METTIIGLSNIGLTYIYIYIYMPMGYIRIVM